MFYQHGLDPQSESRPAVPRRADRAWSRRVAHGILLGLKPSLYWIFGVALAGGYVQVLCLMEFIGLTKAAAK